MTIKGLLLAACCLWIVFTPVMNAQAPERRVRISRPLVVIGSESTDGPDLLSSPEYAAVVGRGGVVILEKSDNTLRLFDQSGRFLSMTGRSGRGPGDMANPTGLFVRDTNSIIVADNVNGLLSFQVSGGQLRFGRVLTQEVRPTAVCGLRANLVVAAFTDAGSLHLLDREGRKLSSFAPGFSRDTNPAVRRLESSQPVLLACDAASDIIFVARYEGADVAAFRRSGELLWSLRLPDYKGNFYFQDRRGALTTGFGEDFTRFVEVVGSDLLLVQVERIRRVRETGGVRRMHFESALVRSFLVRRSDGVIVGVATNLPTLMSLSDDFAVSMKRDPYPTISLHRRQQP